MARDFNRYTGGVLIRFSQLEGAQNFFFLSVSIFEGNLSSSKFAINAHKRSSASSDLTSPIAHFTVTGGNEARVDLDITLPASSCNSCCSYAK